MKDKITIIGGSGFVGSSLCQALSIKKIDFEIIDVRESKKFPKKWKYGDVRDISSLRETITGTIVVNLAAVHRDDVCNLADYQSTNVDGAKNVSLICEEKAISKIVFTSTVAVYGFATPGTDERGAINPFNEYGRSKFEAEEVLRAWYARGKKSLIIVRPTVIFGEGNRGNVFNLFNQIQTDNFIMIGKGQNKKSIAYIGNVVAFLEACISTNQEYGIYNYIDTPNLTMNELVAEARATLKGKKGVGLRLPYWFGLILGYIADVSAKVIEKNLPISALRVKKFVTSTEFSSNKANLDNFTAPFLLSDGIQRTLQREFINPDPNREIFFTE